MSLLSRFPSWGGGRSPAASFGPSQGMSSPDHWILRALGGGKTHAGPAVSEHSALRNTAVLRSISIISETVGQLPCKVLQRRDNKTREAVELPQYRMLAIRPNDHMTAINYRTTMQSHVLGWGNLYSEIEFNRRGEPVSLWPLLPDRTRPFKTPQGELRYRTNIDGKPFELPASSVLHVPGLGFDGYVGYSPIALARQALGLAFALEEFSGKFFANDAKSGGVVMHPGKLSPVAKNNIANSMSAPTEDNPGAQGGLENAHRVKVLEEGMRFVPTTIAPEDSQFLQSRDFSIAEVSRMYGVPLILLSSHEKATSWGSGIEQLNLGFIIYTIMPWLVRWEQELTAKLLSPERVAQGFFIKFNVNALLRGDMAARAAFYRSLYEVRSISPNEIRTYEEMDPYAGGDEFGLPLSSQTPATEARP